MTGFAHKEPQIRNNNRRFAPKTGSDDNQSRNNISKDRITEKAFAQLVLLSVIHIAISINFFGENNSIIV